MSVSSVTSLNTGDFELDRAFRIAMGDILGNVIPYSSGLLTQKAPVLCAGLSYPDPWSRDTALNTWSGAGFLLPEVMKNTLLCCLTNGDASAGMGTGCFDEAGSQVPADCVSIAGQYWDRIIWTVGAWAYYCQNGDREFLALALEATKNALAYLEQHEFDSDFGLFRGGACIHDGLGGYGDRYVEKMTMTAIYGWAAQHPDKRHPLGAGLGIHALSTNCLYVEAYRLVGVMAEELGEAVDGHYATMHATVKAAIQTHLWQEAKGCFRYYLDSWEGCGERQETLGNAFALLFGIATPDQAAKIVGNQPRCAYGPPAIWPDWERYRNCGIDNLSTPPNRPDIEAENQVLRGDERAVKPYGGHGAAIWPMIQGYWAHAALLAGDASQFEEDLRLMADYFCRAVQSPEVVHPDCGLPYGGVQELDDEEDIVRWVSGYRQTWSATSYLRLVFYGIFGMQFEPEGLRFQPTLPKGLGSVELSDVPYRNAILNIRVEHGEVAGLYLNDERVEANLLPGSLDGTLNVRVVCQA